MSVLTLHQHKANLTPMKAIRADDGVLEIHCSWRVFSRLLGRGHSSLWYAGLANRVHEETKDFDMTQLVREHMARGGTPRLIPSSVP